MNYRKEIDGLRAIAVLSVVIYHLDVYVYSHQLLRGGFLGVDIFFVISGYLISSIIIKNNINNNFSITDFYLRRSRRILPAFFFMTFVILILSIIIVSQSDLKEIINSKISSIFFVSNFFFYFSSLDYGGLDSLLKPFLHTWTLSVEEQFYLFFPLFFIFFNQKKRNIYIYLIFFFSFCFSNFAFRYFPNLNFYLIFSRAWELFFGYIILINQNKIYSFFSKKNLNKLFLLFHLSQYYSL
jgi:peptidoglycan/LPS O-acetylase OafA/YrhL